VLQGNLKEWDGLVSRTCRQGLANPVEHAGMFVLERPDNRFGRLGVVIFYSFYRIAWPKFIKLKESD
jgi:hypothetical protein